MQKSIGDFSVLSNITEAYGKEVVKRLRNAESSR